MIKDAKHIYLARCHKICSDNDNFSLLGTTFIVYLYTCPIYLAYISAIEHTYIYGGICWGFASLCPSVR